MRALSGAFILALAAGQASAQAGIACTAGTTSGVLSFGNVVVTAPAGVSTLLGEFVVRCVNTNSNSRNLRLRLAISAGNSGTAGQREMRQAGGPVPLLYNLYEDAAYTVVWTASTGGRPDDFLTIPAQSTTELRRPIFGRVPGSQTNVTAGLYFDTLIASVRY